MIHFEILNTNIGQVVMRFYLMMAVIIAAGFTGYWGFALLGLPIFLSALLGINVRFGDQVPPQPIRRRMNKTGNKEAA